jgi:hypothetical protein
MSTTDKRFSITFEGSEDFEAWDKATQWLREHGFSYGYIQAHSPIGIMHGDNYSIAKWRYLDNFDITTLDGVMESGSKREGPIVVTIYNADLVVPAPAKDTGTEKA